jgi:hypothetical protein
LTDPEAYFFWRICRSPGQPAGDWEAVLHASGIPGGPAAGVILPSNAPFYGITQQLGSLGNVRGRIFLPTSTPDSYDYYTHAIDVVGGDPIKWQWADWLPAQPPYAPRPCP